MDNNKVVVIYKSKYGSTKRYAEWIAKEVKADLFESSQIGFRDLKKYDTIVFGGSLYAVGIIGIELIKENFKDLGDRKIIVFSVGASPARKEVLKHVLDHNFTDEMKQKIQYFHLRGGFNYAKLNFIDKVLMYLLRLKLKMKKKEDLDQDSRELLVCYTHPADWTNKKFIVPIIDCIINKNE